VASRQRRSPPLPARRAGLGPATGGATGNTRLTATTATILLVLLAAEALTLLSLQSFLSWHIFIGLLLVPVVALKIASTTYRFVRYYSGDREYRRAGPPPVVLRLLGPVLVVATLGLFATGVALAAAGPGDGIVLTLHKASFVVWAGAISLHVLAHALRIPGQVTPDLRGGRGVRGARLRIGLVATAVCAGAVAAVLAIPLIAPWTDRLGPH
jgi:hypothetical protein